MSLYNSYGGFTGAPASFKQNLKNQEALEGKPVTLHCELSKAGVPVEWWRGDKPLLPGPHYQMRLDGKTAELKITNVFPDDAGIYSCATGSQKTTAEVKVKRNFKNILNIYCLVPLKSLKSVVFFY